MTRCPECYQGKHDNCTGWVLDEYDVENPCGCQECREAFIASGEADQ